MTMCDLAECWQYSIHIETIGAFKIGIGYQSGRPFSALIADSRSSKPDHLHFPAADLLDVAKQINKRGLP